MKKQETLEWLFVIIIGIIASIIPFVIFNAAFFPFITGKNFVFRILVEVAAIFGICALVRSDTKIRFRNPMLTSLLVFTGLATISTLFSVDPFRSFWSNFERMEGLVTYLHFFVYVSLLLLVVKQKMWDWIWGASIAGSIGMCFFSLYQILGYAVINQGGTRVDGTFGNAIYLAVYMLFNMFITLLLLRKIHVEKVYTSIIVPSAGLVISVLLFLYHIGIFHSVGGTSKVVTIFVSGFLAVLGAVLIALGQYFFYKKKKELYVRTFFGALFFLQGFVLLYTATRGAILGLGAGLLAGALALLFSKKGTKVDRSVSFAIIGLGILSVILFFVLRSVPSVAAHPVFGRIVTVSLNDNTANARLLIWGMALDGIQENPVLGWGLEGFRNVFDKYYDPRMYAQEQWFDRTHNLYLDWAVSGGILGFIAYLSLFVVVLSTLYKKRDLLQGEAAILFGLVVAYMVHNLFVFDNISSLILFGLLLAYVGQMRATNSEEVSSRTDSFRAYSQLAVVLAGVFLVAVNFYQIHANRLLIRALQYAQSSPDQAIELFSKALNANSFGKIEAREQLVQFALAVAGANLPVEAKQKIGNFVAQEEVESMKAQPNDARTWLFASILWRQFGQPVEAENLIRKAIALSPKKQTLRNELTNLLLVQKKYNEAYEYAKETFEFVPSYDEARVILATTMIYAGKNDDAKKLLVERYGTMPLDNRIVRAYADVKDFGNAIAPLALLSKNNEITREQAVLLSSLYLEAGRRTDSVNELKKAISRFPDVAKDLEGAIKEIQAGRNPFL